MTRKRILSTWIGLPGLAPTPAEYSDPGFWDITDILPLAEGSADFGIAIVGPGALQVAASARINGPESRPGCATTFCFTRMLDHNIRIAETIFGHAIQ